jgi:hypothetical protein
MSTPTAAETPAPVGGGAKSYVIGSALGGSLLSIISAGGSLVLEKKKPTAKAIARDFILGAILFLLILQLLPDSTSKLLGYITALVAVPTASVFAAVPSAFGESVASVAAVSEDLEVKVGVPRF